jgi:glycerol-3-phosphate acyltransferase PlsY
MIDSVLVILVAYLIGAVPVAYLTGRVLRGIDIREYGSGNLGPSNIWQNVSKPATIAVGLIEIGQACAGILLAKATGQSLTVQVLAGIAALGAHNWCPFLRLDGGRGVGFAIGFMLVLSWPALGAFTVISLAGVLLRAVPQFVGLGILSAPFWAMIAGQQPEIVAGLAGVAALIMIKRIFGNDVTALAGPHGGEVFLNRLLFDRDTRERERWVRRVRVSRPR